MGAIAGRSTHCLGCCGPATWHVCHASVWDCLHLSRGPCTLGCRCAQSWWPRHVPASFARLFARSWPRGRRSLLPEVKRSGIGFASAACCVSPGAGEVLAAWELPGGVGCAARSCAPRRPVSAGTPVPELFVWPGEERLVPAGSPHTLLFRYRLCAFRSNEKYNYAARIP